jgi:sec-independent protein translocase protein TatA
MGIGWQEILLILLIVLLFFGARRIPEIAKGLGKGVREFKKAMHDVESVDDEKQSEETSSEKNKGK